MATKNTALRNLLADAFGDAMDGGFLDILDGATVLATIPLDADAFAAASSGVLTGNALPIATVGLDDGEADSATLRSADSPVKEITGLTVGVGTGQVQLSSLTIATDQPVNLTAIGWTESATVS